MIIIIKYNNHKNDGNSDGDNDGYIVVMIIGGQDTL